MSFEVIKLRRELEEIISAAVAENEREDAAAQQAFEAAIKAPLEAEIARVRDRLSTIVDEAFGPQEALGMDALLSRLENLLTERARQHEEVRRELYDVRRELNEAKAECDDARTKLAAVREELLVAEGNHCVDRDDHAAEVAKLSAALRNLIDSADASMTRDTIVLCDIDAARAVLGGRS